VTRIPILRGVSIMWHWAGNHSSPTSGSLNSQPQM
jgi:hypothetical protein